MVIQIHAELCGDGSHSHQHGECQGMGVACYVYIRAINTSITFSDDGGGYYDPVQSVLEDRYEEYKMTHQSICTAAVPEFMAIILGLYHGIEILQDLQTRWKVSTSEIYVKVHSDSQRVIDYIKGHTVQVPWLAIMMGMTQALLDHYEELHIDCEMIHMPREDARMWENNHYAIKQREDHLPNSNINPWIERELNYGAEQCEKIKNMLNGERFSSTKTGIKNTHWTYRPQTNHHPIEHLIINKNKCYLSRYDETFMQWYQRQ
jgi:hypothetical protein